MILQEKIKKDLKESMKAKDEGRTSALRVLLGEFQRQPEKELTDEQVMGIIRKLVKSEKEALSASAAGGSDFLVVMEAYLPKAPTEEEVRAWIEENVDFEQFKNRMQAMKPIMAHYAGTVDGNMVKKILSTMA